MTLTRPKNFARWPLWHNIIIMIKTTEWLLKLWFYFQLFYNLTIYWFIFDCKEGVTLSWRMYKMNHIVYWISIKAGFENIESINNNFLRWAVPGEVWGSKMLQAFQTWQEKSLLENIAKKVCINTCIYTCAYAYLEWRQLSCFFFFFARQVNHEP